MNTPNEPAIPTLALRPREAAKALGIGTRTLWALTKAGEIPHVRAGRCTLYPVAKLQHWLNQRAEAPNQPAEGEQ